MSPNQLFSQIPNCISLRVKSGAGNLVLVKSIDARELPSELVKLRVTTPLEQHYLLNHCQNLQEASRLVEQHRSLSQTNQDFTLTQIIEILQRGLNAGSLHLYDLRKDSPLSDYQEKDLLPLARTLTTQVIETNWVELQYSYADDTGVPGAAYSVFSESDEKLAAGKLNDQGYARVNLPLHIKSVKVDFDSDPLDVKTINESSTQSVVTPPEGWLERMGNKIADAGEWTWGTLKGDFNEDPTGSQIITNAILTAIPVVDQVADVRDIVANLKLLILDKRYTETMVWVALFLTLIGLIPTIGSLVKGVLKLLLKNTEKVLKEIIEVFNFFKKGNAIQWLKQLQADMGKHAKKAADIGVAIFDAIIEKINEVKRYIPAGIKRVHSTINDWLETLNRLKGEINGQFKKIGDDFAERIGQALAKRERQLVKGKSKSVVLKKQKAREPEENDVTSAKPKSLKVKPDRGIKVKMRVYRLHKPSKKHGPLGSNPKSTYRFSDNVKRKTAKDVYFGDSVAACKQEVRMELDGKSVLTADLDVDNILDLTDQNILDDFNIDNSIVMKKVDAKFETEQTYNYTTQIAEQAIANGYNGIKFNSTRYSGGINIVLFSNKYASKNISIVSDIALGN